MRNLEDKSFKEMTKLENKEKLMLIFYISMTIFSVVVAIISKDFTWILVALLWTNITIVEYFDAKLFKGKDALIELLERYIKTQDKIITNLLKDLSTQNFIIDIDLIKIPENFVKPSKDKLNAKFEYYNKNKRFEVPIIINSKNVLVDGYTSYLIAKKNNLKTVQVRMEVK